MFAFAFAISSAVPPLSSDLVKNTLSFARDSATKKALVEGTVRLAVRGAGRNLKSRRAAKPSAVMLSQSLIFWSKVKAPEVQAAYGQQGMETLASTAQEAAAHIARETEIWKKVIADAGVRLD